MDFPESCEWVSWNGLFQVQCRNTDVAAETGIVESIKLGESLRKSILVHVVT